MTESKELRFPYTDMTVIVASCKHCGAEMAVDVSDQRQQHSLARDQRLACGVCGGRFDSALGEALAEFIRWFQAMKRADLNASFRVVLRGDIAK